MPYLSARIPLSFEAFRARFDQAFARSIGNGFLEKAWDGEALIISGAGCYARAVYDNGRLAGPIDLSFAAMLISGKIYTHIEQVLCEAGCDEVWIG